jgi:hypothetical protein
MPSEQTISSGEGPSDSESPSGCVHATPSDPGHKVSREKLPDGLAASRGAGIGTGEVNRPAVVGLPVCGGTHDRLVCPRDIRLASLWLAYRPTRFCKLWLGQPLPSYSSRVGGVLGQLYTGRGAGLAAFLALALGEPGDKPIAKTPDCVVWPFQVYEEGGRFASGNGRGGH